MIEDLCLGARYTSYKALETALEKFSQETNSVYTINNSRGVEHENRGRPADKQIPLCLKYKNIKFACKHYGKTRSNSQGLRPNQSSFKIGCPSYIYVSANTKELVVEKFETKHSHSCDPELVSLYPERRTLVHLKSDELEEVDDDSGLSLKNIREDVLDLFALGIENRRILDYVWISTGRQLLLGDLRNLVNKDKEKNNPRKVPDERATIVLENLRIMENKKNGKLYKPRPKSIALAAVKRKVPPPPMETVIKTETISNEDSSEQCYSVTDEQEGGEVYENAMYLNPLQLVSEENIQNEEILYQYENQEGQTISVGHENAGSWNENSSLADVVKSILGPNQEGPVILHVNNYDGVAVVQVADPHSYSISDVQEQETTQDNPTEEAEMAGEQPQHTKLVVRKTISPKKPVVVTAMPADSNKAVAAHDKLLKSAQLTKRNTQDGIILQTQPKQSDQSYFPDEDFGTQDDGSDTHSDHRSTMQDERTLYRVKTKKMKLEINTLKNSIEKQGLEKRKLELEIRLLRMQVAEKEAQPIESLTPLEKRRKL